MKKGESNAITITLIIGLIITSGMVTYALINTPDREETFSISVLNNDLQGVGLISVENNSDFDFYCLIQNFLGYTGYFKLEVLKAEITNDTNPSFLESAPLVNITFFLEDNNEELINIQDLIIFNATDQKFIYYCKLHAYNFTLQELEYSGLWVAMQINLSL